MLTSSSSSSRVLGEKPARHLSLWGLLGLWQKLSIAPRMLCCSSICAYNAAGVIALSSNNTQGAGGNTTGYTFQIKNYGEKGEREREGGRETSWHPPPDHHHLFVRERKKSITFSWILFPRKTIMQSEDDDDAIIRDRLFDDRRRRRRSLLKRETWY